MAPRLLEPDPTLLGLLGALYPTVRWEVVELFEGLPATVRRFTSGAITLPHPLSTHRLRIYFAEGQWRPCMHAGIGLIVHEAFHILQFQERLGGVGLGPLRGFALQYLARAAFEGGGERNAYEAPAYAHERAFVAACRELPRPLCASGQIDLAMQLELLRRHPSLVRTSSDG